MTATTEQELRLTFYDVVLETLAWIFLFVIWILVVLNYNDLPDRIPVHYGASGQPDRFGGRSTVYTLPLIATALFLGLTVINLFPRIFDGFQDINVDKIPKQRRHTSRLIRTLKFVLTLIFCAIALQTILFAKGKVDGLGAWFLPTVIGLLSIPTIFFLKQKE